MAEREGFEPSMSCPIPLFESGQFNHSCISPFRLIIPEVYTSTMEDSIYTKIIKGEVPSHKIYEDDRVIAFLTIQPFAPGHTLVVPKRQVDQLWDLTEDEYAYLMQVVKKLAVHMRQVTGKDRIGMAVKGFEVPHIHVHLVPMSRGEEVSLDVNDVSFADQEELAAIAEKLRFND